MIDQIVLGAIQGVTEWLPLNSEKCVILARANLFQSGESLNQLNNYALFLHLGTFCAAIAYFRQDLGKMIREILPGKIPDQGSRDLLRFLAITTLLTVLGLLLLPSRSMIVYGYAHLKSAFMSLLAAVFIFAGFAALNNRKVGSGRSQTITWVDGLLAGLAQALAVIPGISRVAMAIGGLSALRFSPAEAIRLSILMSLPFILVGNILRNYELMLKAGPHWLGALVAFIAGFFTISGLMWLVRRISAGAFLIGTGVLLGLSVIMRMV